MNVATTTPSTLLSPSSTTPNVRYKASCVLRATWPLRCAPRRSAKRRAYTPTSKAGYLRTKMSALSESGRTRGVQLSVTPTRESVSSHPPRSSTRSTPFNAQTSTLLILTSSRASTPVPKSVISVFETPQPCHAFGRGGCGAWTRDKGLAPGRRRRPDAPRPHRAPSRGGRATLIIIIMKPRASVEGRVLVRGHR